MVQIIDRFLDLFLIPLSFFPEPVKLYFSFVVGFFGFFYIGRALKWLWDMLPAA